MDCMSKWIEYINCVNKFDEKSNFCKPFLKEYNKCVFTNENTYEIQRPKVIEKQFAQRFNSTYWNYENSNIWWSL